MVKFSVFTRYSLVIDIHQVTGQYYLRARYYNPVVGRFLQEDIYRGDGLNLYAYCVNNPVMYYNPSGHDMDYNDEYPPVEGTPGYKVEYMYKGEIRTGYVQFMGNNSKGQAKFAFVGTNNQGYITTFHTESGKSFWKMLNGVKVPVINPK